MNHAGEGQIERLVIGRDACQAARRHCHAVVASLAGDDLLLGWEPTQVVVITGEFEGCVVGVRAGRPEEDLLRCVAPLRWKRFSNRSARRIAGACELELKRWK
jgi:hypothetical protein